MTNKKGERLFLCVIASSNEPFNPCVSVKTWEECKESFNNFTTERDDDSWYIKVINKEIDENYHKMSAKVIMNHKGWGFDYIKSFEVRWLSYLD